MAWSQLMTLATALLAAPAVPADIAAVAAARPSLVFVQRQIPAQGTFYWSAPNAMPGVGAHCRVRSAVPGSLVVLGADGSTRTLVDGTVPTAASLELIRRERCRVQFQRYLAATKNGSLDRPPHVKIQRPAPAGSEPAPVIPWQRKSAGNIRTPTQSTADCSCETPNASA